MKKYLSLVILLLGAAYLASTLRSQRNQTDFDLIGFGRVPVLVNGRIKPLDTVARTSLLTLQGRQRVSTPEISEPFVHSPVEWLADVFFNPAKADTYPTIRIESPEVLTLLGITEEDTRIKYDSAAKRTMAVLGFLPSTKSRFSYSQLRPKLPELDRQARLAEPIESQLRTAFQKQAITVRDRIVLYLQLKTSVQVPDAPDFLGELELFQQALPAGIRAVLAKQKGEAHNEEALKAMMGMAERASYMEQLGNLRIIPPAAGDTDATHWRPTGTALLESFSTASIDPTIMDYARLGRAWRSTDAVTFNRIVRALHDTLTPRYPGAMQKSDIEGRFNAAAPFYSSMTLYAWAFLLARPMVYVGAALLKSTLPIGMLALASGHALFTWGKRGAAATPWQPQNDAADPRAPVLFLRSFEDDQFNFQRPAWQLRLRWFDLWSFRRNVDEAMVDEVAQYGPVVALGRPGESAAPFGAWRHYATHADWQDVVVSTARRARAIVLVAGDSPGLRWEFDLVRREDLLERTVLLFHPDPARAASTRRALIWLLDDEGHVDRLLAAGTGVPVAWLHTANGPFLLRADRPSAAAYVVALRTHFQHVTVEALVSVID